MIGGCLPRQRHIEFLSFLERIERATPRGREIHMIPDNDGTHTHPKVKAWFAAHPRYHLHFAPTGALWLNLMERWFAEITRKRIRRGTFQSVSDLNRAISEYLRENNRHPRPFIWTATASNIMKKITHHKEALDAQYLGSFQSDRSCVLSFTFLPLLPKAWKSLGRRPRTPRPLRNAQRESPSLLS
jgi:transposase